MSATIKKYLQHYAEVETRLGEGISGQFRHCIVIPIRDESMQVALNIIRCISTRLDTLLIVVINQPESQQDSSLNLAFHQALQQQDLDNLLLVNRFSPECRIPDRQGVGLARKIGCDIACQLIHAGQITSPWIHTSDADVEWPAAYPLNPDALPAHAAAACYPFQHEFRHGRAGIALQLYELSLHYYVAGLRFSGSHYAYHSLGSTLVIHSQHYCEVRGFPKRAAGEDFHILNKLRKTGDIHNLRQPLLTIRDRDSDRVPFGTGPAIARIQQLDDPASEFQFYHPDCFANLQTLLACLPRLYQSGNSGNALTEASKTLPGAIYEGLLYCGLDKAIAHAFGHSNNLDNWLRHINNHFDALANLRFIHFQRDNYFASINLAYLQQSRHFYSTEVAQFVSRWADE